MRSGMRILVLVVLSLSGVVGAARAADPPKAPKTPTKAGPTSPSLTTVACFKIDVPTTNQQVTAASNWKVKLSTTQTPPPGVELQWEQQVGSAWQSVVGPTGASWQSGATKEIPVAQGFFLQPGPYRLRAAWGAKWTEGCGPYTTPWRPFTVVPNLALKKKI